MKKITLTLAAFALVFTAFAQTDLVSSTNQPDNPIIINQEELVLDECATEYPSNGFENGFGNVNANEVGDDFSVAADTEFTVENVTVNVFSSGGEFTFATLRFYADADGLPGELLYEYEGEVLASPQVGENFGFPVYGVQFDLAASGVVLNGAEGAESKYWMSFYAPDQTADSFFENSLDDSIDENPMAFKLGEDAEAEWAQSFVQADGSTSILPPVGVMNIAGQCNDLLSSEDNLLSSVSIYPNPANDILNLKTSSSVEVIQVTLFDILGKNSGVLFNNNSLNISNLASGVYLLNIQTTAGVITKKIVKK